MKKSLVLLLCLVLAFSLLTACSAQQNEQEAAQTFTFTDSCGREVELPTAIDKVAPSGAVAQMILYSVSPDTLMGWSKLPSEKILAYFPAEFAALPEFGQFYGKNVSLNMEALIAAAPQVIIDLGDKKPTHAQDMDAIQEQTGIPTIFIEANLQTFPQAFRTLGELLKCSEQAEKIAVYIETTIAEAQEKAAQITEADKKSVFFGTGETGLDANARGSIHADVIELIGAENAVVVPEVSNKGGGNTINMEQLLLFAPDVIVLSADGAYGKIAADKQWQALEAVKQGRYYEIPLGPYNWLSSPPSVNRIIGIKWLGSLVYPDLYNYDMVAEAQEFYKLFWHYDLSKEEAQELLANSTFKTK